MMNYVQVARELMRSLRGARSQVALSRRLGYRTNAAYSWEAGRDFPTAARFFEVAARVGTDVGAALDRLSPAHLVLDEHRRSAGHGRGVAQDCAARAVVS